MILDRYNYNISQNTDEYPLKVIGGEGSTFESIVWYKNTYNSADQVAIYVIIDGTTNIKYKGEYCSRGETSCDDSDRGSLDINSATLTVKDLQYNDEDFYYFTYKTTTGAGTVGSGYELHLTVYGM